MRTKIMEYLLRDVEKVSKHTIKLILPEESRIDFIINNALIGPRRLEKQ
ncbi:MAG: hypothetical protein PHR60_00765 [Eubacteriales bacterium]|nr:hypothetical protein [Eubacteriales bacterium]MDD3873872.1 hypothetical protein [Methanosarcina sp.]MDD4582703.1 hypothetical protein [Eubacteriales bacterium]